MTRTQWTLTAVLLFQLLILLLLAAPWSSGGGATGPRVLLPELDNNGPSTIEIRDGDDRLVLSRNGDGWQVDRFGGYPADPIRVDKLLSDLRQLEVRSPVVKGSRYHDALKVSEDQNERRLMMAPTESDEGEIVLFVGSSPNYGVNHVRRGDESEVYEARGLSPWDLRAEVASWIDTQLIDVRAEDVTSLTLSNSHGEFTLTRLDGTWVLGGIADSKGRLDPAKVDAFVNSIGSLRFSEPAGRIDGGHDFGFGDAAARFELVHDIGGQVSDALELSVGNEVDAQAGSRYAHLSGAEFGVVLAKTDADRLLEKKVEDLLVEAEDGEAEPGR
jgi:hypothetical protein